MQDQFNQMEEEDNEGGNFKLLTKYLFYWKWFVFSVIIGLTLAFFQLRYATPLYHASSKILVRDEKKGNLPSELEAFADMGLLSGIKNNVDNEIEILNSITLIESTVEKLKFSLSFQLIGNVRDVELYKETKPFELSIINSSEKFNRTETFFTIIINSASSFEISDASDKDLGTFHFGNTIALEEAKILIQKLPQFEANSPIGKKYKVYFEPVKDVAKKYSDLLTVESLSKTTSIVNLGITDAVPRKAEDFLNTLVSIYNEQAINDKNRIAENTQKFIINRLKIITEELGDVEGKSEQFKKSNQITDLASNAQIYLENYSQFEKNVVETETQIRVVDIMVNFMKNKSKTELVPTDIIPSDVGKIQNPFISEHNNLVLQRNRILKDGTPKNYVLVNLERQIEDLDRNIKQSLTQLKASLVTKKADLNKQSGALISKINQIPTQERGFRILDRQQKIKEGIYLYLIQKREETAISLTVTEPNAKIIDSGRTAEVPISPKKSIYYLAGILLGLGVPFAVLFLVFLIDNKIHLAKDVENINKNVPILAEIPSLYDTRNSVLQNLEAFRTLANNTNFITPFSESDNAKIIFVTSSVKGEGKTFVSYNLATAYAHLGKKTLLVGVDFRNPQLHKYLAQNRKSVKGLSNYLHENGTHWQDLVSETKNEGYTFDVLLSGDIPPNPSLLLSGLRFQDFINEVKLQYEIVIVDTPPTLLVSDTLIISKYAETTLYVVRSDKTEKNLVSYSSKLIKDAKIINAGYVINDIDFNSTYGYGYGYGYNYGYGYGYGKDNIQKPWYHFYKK